MNTEILTYSRARGVFAGITVDGAVVEQDTDSTRAIYGRDRSFRSILSGKITAPQSTMGFYEGDCRNGTRRYACRGEPRP
jgi:SH3 domain-containing YSC84-like protein 1